MEDKKFVQELSDINKDFAQWYTDVVTKTELMDYGPVKGTMIIRPYGYAMWEYIQGALDRRFKEAGVQNAYFPMFIPESFFTREAEHVDGFAPEVAMVTYAGGETLSERLIVRPTSETIICDSFSKWIKSYRDLPLLVNQWCNIVRWEKTTRPFLRTSEFLWQEGHTVHATEEEARKTTKEFFDIYVDVCREHLAIPMFAGKKTMQEKFAGAVTTYTIESMMKDGKSLQSGTSHYLGQNFAKAFNIQFLSKEEKLEYAHSTSWGVSTRLIGSIIMVHGDERGLVLPPKIAPVQVVIVPIAAHKGGVIEKASEIMQELKEKGIRVKLDDTDQTMGYKFNYWELRGVPIRIELGPKDIENKTAIIFRRDTLAKETVQLEKLSEYIAKLADIIQVDMYEKAKKMRDSRIVEVDTVEEAIKAVDNKNFTIMPCCDNKKCELVLKEKAAITSRFIADENAKCTCAVCGKKTKNKIVFARAY